MRAVPADVLRRVRPASRLEPRNTYDDPAYKPLFGRVFAPIARGRYLATCEGDDYWTSNTKLQRQFDYMEKHVSCVLCCHATRIVREDGGASSKLLSFGSEDRDITCDEVMRGWAEDKGYGITSLHPSSWFSRRQTDLDYAESWHIEASMGDFMRACYFSHSITPSTLRSRRKSTALPGLSIMTQP